jgi:hypothetical protein
MPDPVETPDAPADTVAESPNMEHELSVGCLELVQRLNSQIHCLTQVLAAKEDATAEKAVCRKTINTLNALFVLSGI